MQLIWCAQTPIDDTLLMEVYSHPTNGGATYHLTHDKCRQFRIGGLTRLIFKAKYSSPSCMLFKKCQLSYSTQHYQVSKTTFVFQQDQVYNVAPPPPPNSNIFRGRAL